MGLQFFGANNHGPSRHLIMAMAILSFSSKFLVSCNNSIQITTAVARQCADPVFAADHADKCENAAEISLKIPVISFENADQVNSTVGTPITITPQVLNASVTEIISCSAEPALPAGLSIDQKSCIISGLPETVASGVHQITAKNAIGASIPVSIAITISPSVPVVNFASVSPASGSVGNAMTITPSTLDSRGAPITDCTISPALPAGLSISAGVCVISGTPQEVSEATYNVTATNSAGSSAPSSIAIHIAGSTPTLSYETVTPASGSVSSPISITPSHFNANGGALLSCTADPALPTGLDISQTDCSITGTPQAPSSVNYNITATNSAGSSPVASLTINVSPSVPLLSYADVSPATGTVGNAVTISPTTLNSNGAMITSCEASPALPSGLVMSPSLCVISGTPEAPTIGTYSIIAMNSAGASTAASISLNIQAAAPVVSYAGVSPALGEFGTVITITPSVLEANGAAISACSIQPSLPVGLSLHPALCVVSGTPESVSSVDYLITAENSVGISTAASLVITINALPPVLSFEGVSPVKTYVGSVTTIVPKTLQQNGADLTSCSVDPALPAGLSIDQSTCVISGTPVSESSDSYSITAINSGGSSAPSTVAISVDPQPAEGTCYIAGMAHPGLDANCTGVSATDGKFYINSTIANGYIGGASDTVLLMHMDPSTGANQFVDFSVSQKNLKANGSPQITTWEPKVGSGSGQFDGNSHVAIENPGDELKFSGAFTMETWAKINDPNQRQFFVYSAVAGGGDNYGFGLERSPEGRTIDGISFFWGYWGWYGFWLHTSYIPPAGEWHHYAVTRDSSNTWRIFIDGVATDYQVWQENYSYDPSMPLYGSSEKLIGYMVNGRLDELRISNGSAIYTTNFTPPTTAFDANTGCYSNGFNTNEIGANGSGWCSGNNKYYLAGQETTLNQAGTGTFNGKDYIEGIRIISVSSSGNDSDAGTQDSPFSSAQKAFQEAYAEAGSIVIKLGEGSFGGVDLGTANATNWPSRITVQGVSASSSNLGGILADGTKNVTIIGDKTASLGDVNATRSGYYGGNGGVINLTNVIAGNVSSSGAPNWNSWEPSANGGEITITNSTVGVINSNGGDYYGNGGSITLLNSTAGDINANSGSDGGSGGNIILTNSTSGSVSSSGSYFYGNAGSVTLSASMSGDITAKGGQYGGAGGTVTVTDSGFGTITVDGSPAGTISYYGVNRYMVNGIPFSGVFGGLCYSDGFSNSDLSDGTGICSGDGKYYVNAALGVGYLNGTYYLDGVATSLSSNGSGYWSGVYYLDGEATTLDSSGTGSWQRPPTVTSKSISGFIDSAVADDEAVSGNYVWIAPRWGTAQKRDILTGDPVSDLAIPNGVELIKTGDYIWAVRGMGSAEAYRIHRSTDQITTFNDSHFSIGYGAWASDGYLWLSDPSTPILKKVDAASGGLIATVDLSAIVQGSIRSIRTDADKIGIVSDTKLVFIAKDSLTVVRVVDLPSQYNFNPSETWIMAEGQGAWFLSGGGGGGKTIYRYDYSAQSGSYVDVMLNSIEGAAVNSTGFWVPSTWGTAFYEIRFDGTVETSIDLAQFGITSYPKTRVAVGDTVWIATYDSTLHMFKKGEIHHYVNGVRVP